MIKGKELLLDATVFESKISYPNDVKLLNVVRDYAVRQIAKLKKNFQIDDKIRTYKRKAKKVYLDFAKKKQKSGKVIRKATRKMLNFTGRNLRQLEEMLSKAREKWSAKNFKLSFLEEAGLKGLIKAIENKLKTAKEIYIQQNKKYEEKSNVIKDRIVSFEQPFVRPIKRGKEGGKKTEFGGKAHIALSDGYVFSNKVEHRAFSEKVELESSLEKHQERFAKLPKKVLIDDGYSSLSNKALLKPNFH